MKSEERKVLFRQCASELRPMLWRLASGFAPDADREDLLQEIMMRVWLKLPKFEHRSKLSTWVYRVGLFTAYGWVRKRRCARVEVEFDDTQAATGAGHEYADTLEVIYAALRSMKELDRSILLLALEETPVREIAEILGISENAASVRLHRARKRLGQLLEEEIK